MLTLQHIEGHHGQVLQLFFSWHYKHVKAHQDNGKDYHLLYLELQLNCAMDYNAKTAIRSLNAMNLPHQQHFLLKLICAFASKNKLTANMGDHLRYWAHLKLVRSTYHSLRILDSKHFDLVDWKMVHTSLH
jgi:hypothetical protein